MYILHMLGSFLQSLFFSKRSLLMHTPGIDARGVSHLATKICAFRFCLTFLQNFLSTDLAYALCLSIHKPNYSSTSLYRGFLMFSKNSLFTKLSIIYFLFIKLPQQERAPSSDKLTYCIKQHMPLLFFTVPQVIKTFQFIGDIFLQYHNTLGIFCQFC